MGCAADGGRGLKACAHIYTGYKLNPDTSDHTLLSVQSSPATSFPSLPPLTAHPSSSSSSSSANSPITMIGGSGSISEANSTSILFSQMSQPANNADRTPSNSSSDRTVNSSSSMLLTQMNQLGPSERCTPSQAQAMGQQLLGIMAQSKRTKAPLPCESPCESHPSPRVSHTPLPTMWVTSLSPCESQCGDAPPHAHVGHAPTCTCGMGECERVSVKGHGCVGM